MISVMKIIKLIIETADNFSRLNFAFLPCIFPILTYNRQSALPLRGEHNPAFVGSLYSPFSPLSLPAALFAESSTLLSVSVSVLTIPGLDRVAIGSRACFSLRGRVCCTVVPPTFAVDSVRAGCC